jgi:hypothetical protein
MMGFSPFREDAHVLSKQHSFQRTTTDQLNSQSEIQMRARTALRSPVSASGRGFPRRSDDQLTFEQTFPRKLLVEHGTLSPLPFGFYAKLNTTDICIPCTATCLPSFARSCIETVAYENGCRLRSIPLEGFASCTSLGLIWIPPRVERLEQKCFSKCAKLTAILFAANSRVWHFDEGVFDDTGLRTIRLPRRLRSLKTWFCATDFEHIDVHPRNKHFQFREDFLVMVRGKYGRLWRYCGNAKTIIIPEWTSVIGSYCFRNKPVHVVGFAEGARVRVLAGACFMGTWIKSLEVPAICRVLGESAFSAVSRLNISNVSDHPLEQITFAPAAQLRSIRVRCFVGCYLKCITIPQKVESIGAQAFMDCRFLSTVGFESGSALSQIGQAAFFGCVELAAISIPAGVRHIPKKCFMECRRLVSIELKAEFGIVIDQEAFSRTGVKEFEIPITVERIEKRAFADCPSLETVVCKPGTTMCRSIDVEAFLQCPKLTYVDSRTWTIEVNEDRGVGYLGGASDVFVPATVTVLIEELFSSRTLRMVRFEPEGHLRVISRRAFAYCRIEVAITIPKSVEIIGERCFENSIIGGCLFEDGSMVTAFPSYAFSTCSLTEISIPQKVQRIGPGCFTRSKLERISIPSTVISLGPLCFMSCKHLRIVEFERECKLTSIMPSCFQLTGISSVLIPKSVKTIEVNAFSGCIFLASVNFEEDSELEEIQEESFFDCTSLTEVTLPPNTFYEGSFDDTVTVHMSSE